ncbi:MAG: M23 family metallopeptidase [Spirochaetaceae bacterium]|nr:M23 family metallopeptidase [Spirochaetaceae bacterium]
MTQLHDYKRLENSVIKKVRCFFLGAAQGVAVFFSTLFRIMGSRYTIVLVPHSEKNVRNIRVSLFSMVFTVIALAAFLSTVVWSVSSYGEYRSELTVKDSRLKDTEASLDQLRDELTDFLREARSFEATLSGVFSSLGLKTQGQTLNPGYSGDLSAFFDTQETAQGRLREADDLNNLAGFFASAQGSIQEIENLLERQGSLLTEIPNIWPIRGGIGHISQSFGENPNPFTGENYIHRGIDLSTYRQGDPVVATADGQVVSVAWDAVGFGNYVIIRHKHGFYTRYGHLQSTARVKIGQQVEQGDVIGHIGNTGRSTGPHLHYEVHIGSDIVDPDKFLNIRGKNVKRGG